MAKTPHPIMCRPAGQVAHPLLIDRVVYVLAGRDDAETERRIAQACAAAKVNIARAVACVALLRNQPHKRA